MRKLDKAFAAEMDLGPAAPQPPKQEAQKEDEKSTPTATTVRLPDNTKVSVAKLVKMADAEVAAMVMVSRLSRAERTVYIRANPATKFAK